MIHNTRWGWIDNHPMAKVHWYDAAAFAKWVGGSLPTEQQWEKAARGTDGRKYPWGDTFDAAKCVCSVVVKRLNTEPVGSLKSGASPYGCMDMAGNIWEWCVSDREDYILRGGPWYSSSIGDFHAWARDICNPIDNRDGGFRIVFQDSV